MRLRKFMPVAPIIYPGTAGEIALLKGNAPQLVVRFYAHFEILRMDMETIAHHCEMHDLSHVPPKYVAMIAERLRRTLRPALQALSALSVLVPNNEQIDAEAIGDLDRLFEHERRHLTLRKRLEHYVERGS